MKNETITYSFLVPTQVDVDFHDLLNYCEEEGLTMIDLLYYKKNKRSKLIYDYLMVIGYNPNNFPASILKAIDEDFVNYMTKEE